MRTANRQTSGPLPAPGSGSTLANAKSADARGCAIITFVQASMDDGGTATKAGPVLVRLSEVQPEPVTWLWPGRIARGKLTLIIGDPGQGKSFLTPDLAARVTTGRAWPDKSPAPCGDVVLLTAEDG